MLGEYRVKHHNLKVLHACARDLLKPYTYAFRHVLREYNVMADQMANIAIDKKLKVPDEFLAILKKYEAQ